MRFIIRHLFRDLGEFYVTSFFQSLYEQLATKFSDYTFDIINDPSYEDNGYGSIYSCMSLSIINPKNKKYILISFFDNWKYHFMRHLGWHPSKMVQFFYPGGFNYIDYYNFRYEQRTNKDISCPKNIQNIYESFFYGPYEKNQLDTLQDIYNKNSINKTKSQMYFRGYMWDFRKEMVENIKDNSIVIIDKNSNNNNLKYIDYLKDLSQYRCALSLPGGTEVCNRDIECFALGVPVMRPFLNIQYPDPLIPNYHYISCYSDCKYWDGNPSYLSNKHFADSVDYYWNKIKNNIEYLDFIRNNARKWFLKNCTIQNNIKYVLSKLNVEALYG